MPQVFTDPEELVAFADRLNIAKLVIEEERNRIGTMLKRLGSSWRDDEYEKFQTAFVAVQKTLEEFVKEVEKIVPQLRSDAQDIEQFQRANLPK